jgi:hypothetical protein
MHLETKPNGSAQRDSQADLRIQLDYRSNRTSRAAPKVLQGQGAAPAGPGSRCFPPSRGQAWKVYEKKGKRAAASSRGEAEEVTVPPVVLPPRASSLPSWLNEDQGEDAAARRVQARRLRRSDLLRHGYESRLAGWLDEVALRGDAEWRE